MLTYFEININNVVNFVLPQDLQVLQVVLRSQPDLLALQVLPVLTVLTVIPVLMEILVLMEIPDLMAIPDSMEHLVPMEQQVQMEIPELMEQLVPMEQQVLQDLQVPLVLQAHPVSRPQFQERVDLIRKVCNFNEMS